MINADMRLYDYFTLGDDNGYGQPQLPAVDAEPDGQIKMAINITSQSTQDNVNYQDAQYVGLTFADVDDTYIITRSLHERLKVLYVNPKGRLKQVFMKRI